ncbi:MAG TPA: hypothetical protein VGR16_15075 [Thermomicrobiales bacterium]|nr:hypothetical protein [Thermomicrobiales bacterium]
MIDPQLLLEIEEKELDRLDAVGSRARASDADEQVAIPREETKADSGLRI